MTDHSAAATPSCQPRTVRAGEPSNAAPRYAIATLVTDPAQYAAMRTSFSQHGFDGDCTEYLYIDNTGPNQTDAFRGLNALLDAARAPYVILCHQDVRLLTDDRAALDARLEALSQRDPAWAVAGNAGGFAPGRLALRITDPHGADQNSGSFPARVMSLDENFIVVRRASRVGLSHDLAGFHFYGADICLHARMMGCSAYVIDFHLKHLSPGRKDESFAIAERAFVAKWSRALEAGWMQTTCSLTYLTGDPIRRAAGRMIDAPLAKVMRRLSSLRRAPAPQKLPA